MTRTWIALVGVAVCLTGGCGTVCNLAGGLVDADHETRVYGGVLFDLKEWDSVVSNPSPKEEQGCDPRLGVIILGLCVADPAVSFVADTITLPITLYVQKRRNEASKSEADRRKTVGSEQASPTDSPSVPASPDSQD
jgi:hypothetical protein